MTYTLVMLGHPLIASRQRPDLHRRLHQYSTGMVCDAIPTAGQGLRMVMQYMAATVLLGWQRGEREVDLMNGVLLLHDMHTFASVHILLQHPHLAGPAPLQRHKAPSLSTLESANGHLHRVSMPVHGTHAYVWKPCEMGQKLKECARKLPLRAFMTTLQAVPATLLKGCMSFGSLSGHQV